MADETTQPVCRNCEAAGIVLGPGDEECPCPVCGGLGYLPEEVEVPELPWREDDPRKALKDAKGAVILCHSGSPIRASMYVSCTVTRSPGKSLGAESLGVHPSSECYNSVWPDDPWPEGWRWLLLAKED